MRDPFVTATLAIVSMCLTIAVSNAGAEQTLATLP